MEIKLHYTKDHLLPLTWDELEIGSVYYNMHSNKHIYIKTSSKGYFCITDRTYHLRSKLLTSGEKQYKNYLQVNCIIRIYDGDDTHGEHEKLNGVWLFNPDYYAYFCSNCGSRPLEMNDIPYLSTYCPSCGSEMRIENE